MTGRTDIEEAAVSRFLRIGFAEGFAPPEISKAEKSVINRIVAFVDAKFGKAAYVLGLALDFAVAAQQISRFDPAAKQFRGGMTEADIFTRYPRTTSTAEKNVNTLTLTVAHDEQVKRVGIRGTEEKVCDLFLAADRTGYPSAYVYNTGMWHHYTELLSDCFKLSEGGRYTLCQRLIAFGLDRLPKNTFYGRKTPRPRLFEQIISDYRRTLTDAENAGMVMQGIAYGFLKADRPHLSLIVDKSRTGSAKQRRFGDIDGYYGLDLELSVEVKDEALTIARVETELGQFANDVHRHHAQGLAFVVSADAEARQWLERFGVLTQDFSATSAIVRMWDWHKQDAAVNGLLHFFAHVEQKPQAVTRLLTFIRSRDPLHASLAYLKDSD